MCRLEDLIFGRPLQGLLITGTRDVSLFALQTGSGSLVTFELI